MSSKIEYLKPLDIMDVVGWPKKSCIPKVEEKVMKVVKVKKVCKKRGKYRQPVYKYSLNGDFLARYDSLKDAAFEENIDFRLISRVTRGIGKTAGGFVWKREMV